MQFITKAASLSGIKTACAVVGVFEGEKLSAELAASPLAAAVKRGDFVAKRGKTLLVEGHAKGVERLIAIGLGKRDDFADKSVMQVALAAVEAVLATCAKDAVFDLTATPASALVQARSLAIAVAEKLYKFDATKSKKDTTPLHLSSITLLADKAHLRSAQDGFAHGKAMGEGITLARHLGNLPPNVCTPTFLGNTAKDLAKQFKLKVMVHDRAKAEQLKMGSFISVSKGSDEPLKFIELHYNGAAAKAAPIVLVGKAITFDTGGISLKPGANMDEMKFDMCGGASVLGTFRAVAELGLKINLIGLIPACENMPNGNANKPGDVVTSMSGQTVEILNTDAEGRLILNDALTYAERFKPAAVIDIATLTGAMVIALGPINTGLFSSNDELAEQLLAAGRQTNDRAWRMPLEEEYQDLLKSNFADMANIGGPAGGSITAACFLHRYAKNYPWAHLDIAGTAWKQGAAKGATGRPVSLLTQFLISRASAK